MIKYFTDDQENVTIAVYTEGSHKKIIRKLNDILNLVFLETEEQEDLIDIDSVFVDDTVVVPLNSFSEDYLELVDSGIFVYVVSEQ